MLSIAGPSGIRAEPAAQEPCSCLGPTDLGMELAVFPATPVLAASANDRCCQHEQLACATGNFLRKRVSRVRTEINSCTAIILSRAVRRYT
jgi:hypothetical protein